MKNEGSAIESASLPRSVAPGGNASLDHPPENRPEIAPLFDNRKKVIGGP